MPKHSYYRVYNHWSNECIGVLKSWIVTLPTWPFYSSSIINHTGVHTYLKDISQAEYETYLAFGIKDFGTIDKVDL